MNNNRREDTYLTIRAYTVEILGYKELRIEVDDDRGPDWRQNIIIPQGALMETAIDRDLQLSFFANGFVEKMLSVFHAFPSPSVLLMLIRFALDDDPKTIRFVSLIGPWQDYQERR